MSSDSSVIQSVLVGVVCLVLGAGGYAGGMALYESQGKPRATAASAAGVQMLVPPEEPVVVLPPPPSVVDVARYAEIVLEPGYTKWYSFDLTDPRTCVLTGHIQVTAGGNHDVNVLVVDDDGLANVRNHTAGYAYDQVRRTSAVTLDTRLPSPGRYHLVISNDFSRVTAKGARVENVQVTCG